MNLSRREIINLILGCLLFAASVVFLVFTTMSLSALISAPGDTNVGGYVLSATVFGVAFLVNIFVSMRSFYMFNAKGKIKGE